uniref:Uncharacterized protein n=1 Tax=Anguilla anguilla TaxID=7936 RepID=A0A0E9PSX5_ANGAN
MHKLHCSTGSIVLIVFDPNLPCLGKCIISQHTSL